MPGYSICSKRFTLSQHSIYGSDSVERKPGSLLRPILRFGSRRRLPLTSCTSHLVPLRSLGFRCAGPPACAALSIHSVTVLRWATFGAGGTLSF